jgi:cell division inhibitor SepF
MGGALRKTMIYLGLAEDEERYDPYDVEEDFADFDGPDNTRTGDRQDRHELHEVDPMDDRRSPVTPINRGQMPRVAPMSSTTGELHRISTIHPRTYNEAKTIGESFRSGTPVIMNLTDMDDADAKRLVDFAAGLVFGLQGTIERVTSKVFLLSPANVEVASADKVRTPDPGFFNQN